MRILIIVAALVALSSTASAKVWTNDDFGAPQAVEEIKASTNDLNMDYVKRSSSDYLVIGITANYKYRLNCVAFDSAGNVVGSVTRSITVKHSEILIKDNGQGVSASCHIVK